MRNNIFFKMKSNTRNIFISISFFIVILSFEIIPSNIFSKFGFTNISLLPKVLADSGNDYFQKATIAVGKKDYENAIFYGEKGIKYYRKMKKTKDPKFIGLLTVVGLAKMESGNLQGAIENFEESILFSPDSYGYNLLGMAKEKAKDFKGAIEAFTKSIEAYKGSDKRIKLDGFTKRGFARLQNGDHKGAIDDYSEAIKILPDASFYMLRGYNKYLTGDFRGNCEDIFMAEKIGTLDQNEINKMKDNFKCLLFE